MKVHNAEFPVHRTESTVLRFTDVGAKTKTEHKYISKDTERG